LQKINYILESLNKIEKTKKSNKFYDDWGMPTYKSDGSTIGNELLELNPFMYKGYFYDREIKMYYLKSRYYDPDLG